jgi:anthranilate synthase component 1
VQITDTTVAQIWRLPADNIDLLAFHTRWPERYPHLLQSVAQGALGRFDILFAYPQSTQVLSHVEQGEAFIRQFEQTFARLRVQTPACDELADVPFYGGWMAYFSYEYAQVIEPCLNLPPTTHPLAILQRFPAALIVDHHTQSLLLVAESAYIELLSQMQADLTQVRASELAPAGAPPLTILQRAEQDPQHYLQGVETIKDYILAGDVFQVNLSRQWQVSLSPDTDASAVYRQLRLHNPAPFACLVRFDDWAIVSSSPERLVRYRAPWVETRPIAGTRKRSASVQQDLALIDELIAHPKERAEHIMLIDLERNDLGRICQPGSVEVNELMVVESYEHVHHIVSNVRGRLQAGLTPLQVIHALFPGGTITGCPKIRCMQIIAELEQGAREAYTGSVGYINLDGSMDFNILIRSFVQTGSTLSFRAGAGIVADSQAPAELEETRHKARGLLRALGEIGT